MQYFESPVFSFSADTFSWTERSLTIGLLGIAVFTVLRFTYSPNRIPLINTRKLLEIGYSNAIQRFLVDGPNLVKNGLRKFQVFRILTNDGYQVVLAPEFAKEVRNSSAFSLSSSIARRFHADIKGFEPFDVMTGYDRFFAELIRAKLTPDLESMFRPISDETAMVLDQEWTNNSEWHSFKCLKPSILAITAQLSSRVFLGEPLCRDPNWVRITMVYTVDSHKASQALRRWPAALRPIIARLLPSSRKIRAQIETARQIIESTLAERRRCKQAAKENGLSAPQYNDALEWVEELGQEKCPHHPVMAQLALAIAGIHNTAETLTQLLYDIYQRKDLADALREEAATVIARAGLTVSGLNQLELMDSTMKESMRLKPPMIAAMQRITHSNVTLSDGTRIDKDSSVIVSATRMWDPKVYANPETFDAYRSLRAKQASGNHRNSQAVTPTPEHLVWGLGKYACPGRFFAVAEIKIILLHILLDYDLKVADGACTSPVSSGFSFRSNPNVEMFVRRRREGPSSLAT
ncbi:cytochrome P450 [Aspergillus homomorphus CBS 101889]|uniref:Cytochrome protein n=1 Tax=Aspergillus homomorphus (strain CBS 101889) TaxID=1450537 RepID=A0A395I4L2_ASPHC|nr:cytochrome protein [Aspergillus homomorphus CBS 101889]RAL14686.1 cytochrome protein [Aspergillus homomorphus CBS 101889]